MSVDRRTLLTGVVGASLASGASAQTRPPATSESRWLSLPELTDTIDLWPALPPGAPATLPPEAVHERSNDPAFNDRYIVHTARPRMVVFRPKRPTGGAVLITPGGGYVRIVVDKEGYEVARWLAGRGITAFVLFYRLPGDGWVGGRDAPLQDAQRAIRLIRSRAGEFKIDPHKVTAIGFSAGGHVCASLLTRFAANAYAPVDAADQLSARPDGAAPIYPVISMSAPTAHMGSRDELIGQNASRELERKYNPALNVPRDAPPSFLLHAEDDPAVPIANTLMLREALLAARVPVETQLYADGGHGFGLRMSKGHSVEGWQDVLWAWGVKRRLFSA